MDVTDASIIYDHNKDYTTILSILSSEWSCLVPAKRVDALSDNKFFNNLPVSQFVVCLVSLQQWVLK